MLGWGPENFVVAFDKFYDGALDADSYPWFDKVHNMFLEIGVTSGLLGLISFLVVLFLCFKSFLGGMTVIGIALASSLVAYLSQNMFGIDSTTSFIYLHLLFGLADFMYKNDE